MDWNFTLRPDGGPSPLRYPAPTPAEPAPAAQPRRRRAPWMLPLGVVATLFAGGLAGLLMTPTEEPALKPGQPIMPVELARVAPAPAAAAAGAARRLEVLPAGPSAAAGEAPPSPPTPQVEALAPDQGVLAAPRAFGPAAAAPHPPPQYAPRRLEPPPPDDVARERIDDAPRYAPPPRRPLDDPEDLEEDEEPSA